MSAAEATDLEIRGVLLPLHEAQLLLPNASVSEVVGLEQLKQLSDVPEWFLGTQEWRGQVIPVISFEKLLGLPVAEPGVRARVAVCNTLGGNKDCPFIGLLLASTPRLVRITEDAIAPQSDEQELGEAVKRQVIINEENAWIPDMNSVEWVVQEAVS
jgi:chemosensory pili system protein ChpC